MDSIEDISMPETAEIKEVIPWYQKEISLSDAKLLIKTNIASAARSFIAIGFYLKRVRDEELYKLDEYQNIWDFAKGEYGISKTTASRYMNMNDRFSVDGNSPIIQKQYRDFDKSKLQEMLYLEEDQLQEVRPEQTVKEIRNLKREIPYIEIPGQVSITDFPEFLPDSYYQTMPVPQEIAQSQPFSLNVSDMIPDQGVATSQQVEEPETYGEGSSFPADNMQNNLCTESGYVPEAQRDDESAAKLQQCDNDINNDVFTPQYFLEEQKQKLDTLLKISKARELYAADVKVIERQKMIVAGLERMVIDLETVDIEPEPQDQPELPILRNNNQRAEFIDAYDTWPLWIETHETGERYYRYDLPDDTAIVVKVYHAKLFDYYAPVETEYENRFKDGWGRNEYYLLQPDKHFRDCETNRSLLVEKLKRIQKKEKVKT